MVQSVVDMDVIESRKATSRPIRELQTNMCGPISMYGNISLPVAGFKATRVSSQVSVLSHHQWWWVYQMN